MNALLIRNVCEAALMRFQISGGSSQTDARDAARQIVSELSCLARANVMTNDIATLIRDMSFLAHMCAPLHTVVVGPGAESTRRARYRLVAHCLTCLITNDDNPDYSDGRAGLMPPTEGDV